MRREKHWAELEHWQKESHHVECFGMHIDIDGFFDHRNWIHEKITARGE